MNSVRLLMVAVLTVAVGCQNMPRNSNTELNRVLVTLHADGRATHFGGSKRSYHGQGWSASLHLRRSVASIARGHQITETQAWPIKSLDLLCVVYAVPQSRDMEELVDRLNADVRTVTAYPMQEYHGLISSAYNDPLFELQYGEHRESLAAMHAITRGENVRVGVIDSQIDTQHPDLNGQIHKLHSLVEGRSVADQRHGTAVVGIIGALADNAEGLVGLAPGAILDAYAACDHAGTTTRCTSFSLALALDQAIADNIDVLNLSLAGPQDPLLQRLIERARQSGMLIVAAENSADPERNFPASMPQVLAAQDADDLWFARNEQLSTQAGGGYQVFYGSSVAAAGVAAVAALLRSQYTAEHTSVLLTDLLNHRGCDTEPMRSPLLQNLNIDMACE